MKKFAFILCSRNDSYCGQPIVRLTNTLTFLGHFLNKLGIIDESECILTDWGSKQPLHKKLSLNNDIKKIIKFVNVSSETAEEYNEDSPFSQAHALNCAFQNSESKFIIKIDQDTILGPTFINWLSEQDSFPDISFSTRRNLDQDQSPKFHDYILSEGSYKKVNIDSPHYAYGKFVNNSILPFFGGKDGVLMIRSEIFKNYLGFNEDLIYQNHITIDLINRLIPNYSIYNLGLKLDFDFYHQYHSIDNQIDRVSNSHLYRKNIFPNNNEKNWGLKNKKLEIIKY